jgi:hypothetical protein
MQQDKLTWRQQLEQLQEESNQRIERHRRELQQQYAQQNEMRNKAMADQNMRGDDTEAQMVEQILQFERNIEVLRDANKCLASNVSASQTSH